MGQKKRRGAAAKAAPENSQMMVSFAMQLSAGQLISVTCKNVVDYPHEGIVSLPYGKMYLPDDAGVVMRNVRVIHFCRGDPDRSFPDGTTDGDPDSELRVRETNLAWFTSQGRDACIVAGPPSPFSPNRIVRNARELLGARDYNVFKRNCQSFANYCYYGKAVSNAVLTGGYIIGAGLVVAAGGVVYVANLLAHTPWAM